MKLNSANEHVQDIERRNIVDKERTGCVRHSLPFNRIQRLLLIRIVFLSVKVINYLPTKGVLSTV